VELCPGAFLEIENLFSRLDSEKKTGELLQLPEDFYTNVNEEVSKLEETDHNGTKQAANTKKTLAQFKNLRMQKILIYLAYNKQLPSPLPKEETEAYKAIKKLLEGEINIPKATKIRILEKVPEIITTSGKKIGPFEKGEIVTPEKETDIEFIVNNKIGEIVV
jgi:DNA replication initiation complex subunit (GINS family)